MTSCTSLDSAVRDVVKFYAPSITDVTYQGQQSSVISAENPILQIGQLKDTDGKIHNISNIETEIRELSNQSETIHKILITVAVAVAVLAIFLFACVFVIGLTPFAGAITLLGGAVIILSFKCWSDLKFFEYNVRYLAERHVLKFQSIFNDVINSRNLIQKEMDSLSEEVALKSEVEEKAQVYSDVNLEADMRLADEQENDRLVSYIKKLIVSWGKEFFDYQDNNAFLNEKGLKRLSEIFVEVCVESPCDCADDKISERFKERCGAISS